MNGKYFKELYVTATKLINENNPRCNTIPNTIKQDFLQFDILGDSYKLRLIRKLSQIQGLPQEMVEVIKNFPYLNTLPDEIFKEMTDYVRGNPESMSALVITERRAHTLFQPTRILAHFLQLVAFGQQNKAKIAFLQLGLKQEEKQQALLRNPGTFTDYSGRTFHCTAYEYAYWAKDKHMCRMLEELMNEKTKAMMLKRCEEIERIGLTYEQSGKKVENSKHFDFTQLKVAVQNYANKSYESHEARQQAWRIIGQAQRELPVHVINEYCRQDRSFEPVPNFDEENLPRVLTYNHYEKDEDRQFFPLAISSSDLCDDFTLVRHEHPTCYGIEQLSVCRDLMAINRLDEVRTKDLEQSRKNLQPIEPTLKFCN